MWKLWVQANIIFLIVLLAVLSGVSAMHRGQPDWPVVGAFSATAALPFSIATCLYLRSYHRERVRRQIAHWTAMQAIVVELARQSLTEISVFMTAFERGADGETVLVTSKDNSNHQALQQMADLGIARLIASDATGDAACSVVTLRYGFDLKGLGFLFSLVEAAAKRRAFFERTSQLDVNGADARA